MGIVLLKKHYSIPTAIITRENTQMVVRRAEKLQIEYCFQGIKDKIRTFNELVETLNLSTADVAYVGDDVNDLDVLQNCGFSFCPSDAEDEVKEVVGYICKKKGGEGVIREIANLIMRSMRESKS
ncbi:MAG: HAD hydrolase family protein [bacterium]